MATQEYSQGEANTRFCGRGIKKSEQKEGKKSKKKATIQHKKRLELNYTFTHG
jgi:hypothetical protein